MAEHSPQLRLTNLAVSQILQSNGVQNEVIVDQIASLIQQCQEKERVTLLMAMDQMHARSREDIMELGSLKKELSAAVNARNYSLAKMAARGYLESLADVIRTVHTNQQATTSKSSKLPTFRGPKSLQTAAQSSASEPYTSCDAKVINLHSNSNALAHLYHCSILPPNINALMLNLKTLYPTIKQEFGKTLYAKLSDAIYAYTDIDYDTLVVPHDLKEEETALILSLGQLAPKSNLLILEPDGNPVAHQTISRSTSLQTFAKQYNLKG